MVLTVKSADIIALDYNDLLEGKDLTSQIALAFGIDGIGVLTVKNVPKFSEARDRLLPISHEFANLPDEVKRKYEHPSSFYSFGWSHGKEKLQGGKADVAKGSYYINPQYDKLVDDEAIIQQHPSFVHPNIWPEEDLPELAPAFKELGQIIVQVGILVAQQCDRYVRSQSPSYPEGMLTKIIESSKCCKARLLHYFPLLTNSSSQAEGAETADSTNFSSWCGWHNDHGSLTGLAPGLFLDAEGRPVNSQGSASDPAAGLYVMSRTSELIKVNIPADQIGFQIGETAQIHSGGILQATPHAVRGSQLPNISRESYAVFMEPMFDEAMVCPAGVSPALAQSQSSRENLPQGVPPLHLRWQGMAADSLVDGGAPQADRPQTFGEFSTATHQAYY